MEFQKRNCPLEIELVPKGAGWTHLYLTVGGKRTSFLISNVMGNQFSDLVRALYFITPKQGDMDNADDIIESKVGTFDIESGKVTEIFEDNAPRGSGIYKDIPYRAEIHRYEHKEYYDFEFRECVTHPSGRL